MANYPYFVDVPVNYGGMMNTVNPQQMAQQQQAPQQFQMKQILDPTEQNLLKEKGASRDGFYTPITKVEEAASRCTHKYNNGTIALGDPDDQGYRTCAICHTRFHAYEVDEISAKAVEEKCEEVRNIMESIKLYKGDIDVEIGRTIYPFTTILKQIPNMWKNSVEYIKKYVGAPVNGTTVYGGTAITPAALYSMMYQGGTPVYGGVPQMAYTQPVMGAQPMTFQQPVVPQQPAVMPQVPVQGAPVPPTTPTAQPVAAPNGYAPYGTLTPNVGVPAAQMANPIGNYVQATQQVAPTAAPTQPTAAVPPTEVKPKFEN